MLRRVPLELEGPEGNIQMYALLEEGSTITLLENKIISMIGLVGGKDTLCMQWTNYQTQTNSSSG